MSDMRSHRLVLTSLLVSAAATALAVTASPAVATGPGGWSLTTLPDSAASGWTSLDVAADGRAFVAGSSGTAWYAANGRTWNGPTQAMSPRRCPLTLGAPMIGHHDLVVGMYCAGATNLVLASTDGNRTYRPRSTAGEVADAQVFSTAPDGRLWTAWTNVADASTIFTSSSTDDGVTWSAPAIVDRDPAALADGCNTADPTLHGCALVGNGELSVVPSLSLVAGDPSDPSSAWLAWVSGDARDAAQSNVGDATTKLWVAHTADAGQHWNVKEVLDAGRASDVDPTVVGTNAVDVWGRAITVDERGNPAVVFTRRNGSTASPAYLISSSDGGRHWSAPRRVGQASSAAEPAISARPGGGYDIAMYTSTTTDPGAEDARWDAVHAFVAPTGAVRVDRLAVGVATGPIAKRGSDIGHDSAGHVLVMFKRTVDGTPVGTLPAAGFGGPPAKVVIARIAT